MTTVEHSPPAHSPLGPDAKRPKGILKRASSGRRPSPPGSPQELDHPMSFKEVTLANTQINAGHRRSSSKSSRRRSSNGTAEFGENAQRLKWDETNLYLAEQERTATMKINEPKTPYAKHYDPAEDPSDLDGEGLDGPDDGDDFAVDGTPEHRKASGPSTEDGIPGLSLGEPEEEVPEGEAKNSEKSVHLPEPIGAPAVEGAMVGLSTEEIEKHQKFEEMRKKHYEMRDVAHILGHPEAIPEDDDDDGDEDEDEDEDNVPPVPPLPRVNGSA